MRKLFLTLALLLAATLSACDASTSSAPAAAPPADVVAASQKGTGFTAGSAMAKQTVYVYFDTQCPHCGELWKSFKPLANQVRMVWIPIGVLNNASVSQGAALLAAKDPVQAMDQHESLMRTNRSGMSAAYPSSAQRRVIEANTALFQRIGGTSFPLIVTRHAVTGATIQQAGSAPTAALRQLLGLGQ